MQVQHEACLIEPSPPSFAEHVNKSLDSYCLLPQLSNSLSPVEQIAICPGGGQSSTSLVAVHLSANNQIVIIDTQSHQRRDKFPLKAYDKRFSKQSFHVSGLAFSPDGHRLAVGQTDCIIYIYKLALGGGGQVPTAAHLPSASMSSQTAGGDASKKGGPVAVQTKTTISGKFASSSPVTCLVWSELGLIFGGQDGKVRLVLSFNKPPQAPLGATVSDQNSRASGQTQAQQAGPPKVVTLFTGSKGMATPICLAYRAPVLLVGQSTGSIQILVLSTFSTSAGADEVGLNDANSSLSDVLSQLAQPLAGASSGRRNSSSVANSSSSSSSSTQAPVVLQSHTIEHSCPPVHLTLIQLNHAHVVCCSGPDGKIAFHSLKAVTGPAGKLSLVSQLQQTIDVKEAILASDYSHINEILVLATKNRLMFVRYDQQRQQQQQQLTETMTAHDEGANRPGGTGAVQPWRLQTSTIELRRVLTLTGVRWTRDGTQIAVGCSSGSLELFRCQWSKQSMNDKLDICHIARNRIRITDRERNLLATYKTLHDIKRVNLLDGGQSVLVWTTSSLLLAKLDGPQSEIPWLGPPGGGGGGGSGGSRRDSQPSGSPAGSGCKFHFDSFSDYVIIYHEASRELRLLKLGQDSVIFTVQLPVSATTDDASCTIKRHLLSVCQYPPKPAATVASTGGARKLSLSPNRIAATGRPALASSNSSRQSSAQQQARGNSSGSGLNDAVNATLQLLEETTSGDQGEVASTDQVSASNQVERFAHLSSRCQLEIIDLISSNQLIYSHRHAHRIDWLAFSHTGRLLAFLDASGQLNLLQIKQQQLVDNQLDGDLPSELEFKLQVLLAQCELNSLVQWLPESDSLLAQAGPIVYLWHDPHDCGASQVVEKFDTRSYNFLRKLPIIDLSLLSGENSTLGQPGYPKIKAIVELDQQELAIELTNSQHIRLDKAKTQFYAKLASGSLESALELLDKFSATAAAAAAGRPPVDSTSHNRLYAKLGWLAIERAQCELAWRIFHRLQYKSLARYLEQCLAAPAAEEANEETTSTKTTGVGDHRQALMLAKLRGDWHTFERLLAHDLEEVAATYRRLNKWTRLVEFLARKQQFRQRDLAERDQISWLLEQDNRQQEAAELMANSSGDLAGALKLLLERCPNPPDGACEFALRNEQKLSLALRNSNASDGGNLNERRLRELLETELCDKLVAPGNGRAQLSKAAEICDRILGDFRRALELYLEAGDFELALRVAVGHSELSDRVDAIHLQCADNLRDKFLADRFQTSGKRARAAIDHYLRCNQFARALEMANHLHASERGHEILARHWDELNKLKELGEQRELILAQASQLAKQLQDAGEHAKAALALEMAEDYARLVQILVEQGELERAFAVSLEHLHAGDRSAASAKFIELADSYATEGAQAAGDDSHGKLIERAGRIFLLVDRPQLAIEMHEKLGQYDRMLSLIERHQTADQLEASLLQLARSLELAGKLEEAEKYLLRASPGEWTSVVRMYRLAKRWPDAFRVARANCLAEQDPLLVQLAYWWAKSLIWEVAPSSEQQQQHQDYSVKSKQAYDLLRELNLFKQVIEFACEAKNFQFALDVCGADHADHESPPAFGHKVKRELVLRYATFLEQQHKFAEAESLLVDNNLVELAAKMRMDNDQHTEAIRVIERQLEEEAAAASGGDATQLEAQQRRRQQLVDLLNSTLVECAQRIVADLSATNRRTPPMLMRSQSRTGPANGGELHPAPSWAERLQMAQQMFLRAQRPELALEMYQSLGMWQEAIQVAQRFAPRLLEGVERALDQQVQADIEPILRETNAAGSALPAEPTATAASSSGGDTESVGSSAAADQNATPRRQQAPARTMGGGAGASSGQTSALRAWRQFEFAYRQDDRRSARLHFDKYLSLLLVNVDTHLSSSERKADTGQVARQLRHLAKFLHDCRTRVAHSDTTRTQQAESSLIGSILRQRDTSDKIKTLAKLVFMLEPNWCSLDLSCVTQAHATWSSLRNILADCAHLLDGRETSGEKEQEQEEEEGERRADRLGACLQVAHYVTLYVSLVRHLGEQKSLERVTIKQVELMAAGGEHEPARDLLSKLSFALVRHANLLDLGRVLYLAGMWQLARGHATLTRRLWGALLEWHDDASKSDVAAGSQLNGRSTRVGVSSLDTAPTSAAPSVLGQFVANLPADFMVFSAPATPANGLDWVNHVRHWLLETLIGPTSGAKTAANGPAVAWARLDANSLACLVCGLPAPSGGGSLHLSARVALRAHELEELLNLCGDAQSNSHGVSLTSQHLEDILGRRRRNLALKSAGDGPRAAPSRSCSSAVDQLSEIVDFIIDLSALD